MSENKELVALQEEKLVHLANALADPLDFRTPAELAEALDMTQHHILRLQSDPEFMEPVVQKFHRSMSAAQMFILKRVFSQVNDGNIAAARLGLEALKAVDTPGTSRTLVLGAGSPADDDLSRMTDEQLDLEIHRLLMDTAPEDVEYAGGRVQPATFVEVEVVDADDA